MLMWDHPLSFTTARFNNGGVGEESGIVTSSGSVLKFMMNLIFLKYSMLSRGTLKK